MNAVLGRYISRVYHQPMNIICNNCFHKAIRIFKEASKLRVRAELIVGVGITPPLLWGIRLPSPHSFVMVDGQKVDVALSPEQEEKYWRNGEGTLLWSFIAARSKFR